MELSEYRTLDATDLVRAYKRKEVTSDRILGLARELLAQNLKSASIRELYMKPVPASTAGLLFPVPMLHKDSPSGAILGYPLEYSSPLAKGIRAEQTTPLLRNILRAGGQILGRTQVPELVISITGDNSHFGSVPNPFNSNYSMGGSTSGVAALALGCVPIVQGADAGGSLRIPASWSGCFALKPTSTQLTRTTANCFAMDEDFFATRSIRDLRLLLRSTRSDLCGTPEAFSTAPGRIALCSKFFAGVDLDGDQVELLETFRHNAGALGWEIDEIELGLDFEDYCETLFKVFAIDLCSTIDKITCKTNRRLVGNVQPYILDWYEAAKLISDAARSSIQTELEGYSRVVDKLFGEYSLVVTPVTGKNPPRIDTLHSLYPGEPRLVNRGFEKTVHFCGLFNISGHPALAIPYAKTSDGLPIGLQLVSARGHDYWLLEQGGKLTNFCNANRC